MTQETKLGLVIGGIFIVCFSILLSNAHDELQIEDQTALLERAALADSAVVENRGGELDAGLPALLKNHAIETRSLQSGVEPAPTALPERVGQLQESNSLTPKPVDSSAEDETHTLKRQSPLPDLPPKHRTVTDAIANRPTQVGPMLTGSVQDINEHAGRAAYETELSGSDDIATLSAPGSQGGGIESGLQIDSRQGLPPALPSTPRAQRVQVYVVKSGDNLTKIARKFYGMATPDNIEAIYQANGRRLSDKDQVKVGQKLNIPLDSASQARDSTAKTILALSTSTSAELKPSSEITWRWYQVKKNDRYITIAQRELKDKSRWKEIFELNKHIFPDPGLIRTGVRIKLPVR